MIRYRIASVLVGLFLVGLAAKASEIAAKIDRSSHDLSVAANPPADLSPERFSELDQWEETLLARERALEELRASLSEERAAIAADREAFRADQDRAAADALSAKRLSALYGAMDPDQAAQALSGLPVSDAARIVSTMSPEAAGPILSALPRGKSGAIAAALIATQPPE